MLTGILDLSIWGYVVATLIVTHVTIASVTLYLHRSQAHRAVDMHPVINHFFRFWLWMTTGMVTKEWVAIHRKHHSRSDREGDPHSPQVFGLSKVVSEGAELYRAESENPETIQKFGHGTPDDWVERTVYSRAPYLGIALLVPVNVLLFGIPGITIWAIQMLWIPFWAAGIVNGVGHYWGYRNFECSDASTNISPWGIVVGGEELHNNHHAYPSSARFSARPWEFDIGWMYLNILRFLGLASIKKVAPRPVVIPGKQGIDMETLRAVVVARLDVTAQYARNVILPVLRQESTHADGHWQRLLKQSRAALVNDKNRVSDAAREQLKPVLERFQNLRTVYQYRQQLQELWDKTATSHEQLLQSLQDWVQRAEATGIDSLQEFARSLRGYTLGAAH